MALLVLIMIIVAKLNDSLKRKETFTDIRAQETVDSISVYLINLDVSKDRLEFMNEQCKREKIEYARFPAVNGKELDISSMDNVTNKKMTRGAVGCTLSHIGIWEDAERKGHENIMVLEDDVVLAKNFKAKLAKILSEVPDDFDILYLGGSNLKVKRVSPNIGVPKKTKAKGTFNTGTYAMVINKKALPVLLRMSHALPHVLRTPGAHAPSSQMCYRFLFGSVRKNVFSRLEKYFSRRYFFCQKHSCIWHLK